MTQEGQKVNTILNRIVEIDTRGVEIDAKVKQLKKIKSLGIFKMSSLQAGKVWEQLRLLHSFSRLALNGPGALSRKSW